MSSLHSYMKHCLICAQVSLKYYATIARHPTASIIGEYIKGEDNITLLKFINIFATILITFINFQLSEMKY